MSKPNLFGPYDVQLEFSGRDATLALDLDFDSAWQRNVRPSEFIEYGKKYAAAILEGINQTLPKVHRIQPSKLEIVPPRGEYTNPRIFVTWRNGHGSLISSYDDYPAIHKNFDRVVKKALQGLGEPPLHDLAGNEIGAHAARARGSKGSGARHH